MLLRGMPSSADVRQGCRRSDKRESHGTPPSLVASGDVRQEEKIKTAGLETSDPLEEEPAGCQRSDKKDSRQDASDPIRGKAMERHHSRRTGTPSDDWGVAGICDLVASADLWQ